MAPSPWRTRVETGSWSRSSGKFVVQKDRNEFEADLIIATASTPKVSLLLGPDAAALHRDDALTA